MNLNRTPLSQLNVNGLITFDSEEPKLSDVAQTVLISLQIYKLD